MKDLVDRINNLEIKFSYQDELINELSLIISDQQTRIEELSKALKRFLQENPSSGTSLSKDEKPPHY